jgi:metal-sulfur cluster biosynthetic enzyme
MPSNGRRVDIEMTLTAPGCGMGDVIANDVWQRVMEVPTVEEVSVEVVFDPPWNASMMTDEARLQTGMF